jgi:hypothetical protein
MSELGWSIYIGQRAQSRIDQAILEVKLRIRMTLAEEGMEPDALLILATVAEELIVRSREESGWHR